jgi:O-antigen/teichoic acid export membrane protein
MGQGLGAFLSNNFDLLIIGKFGNQLDTIDYSATSRINLAVDLPSAANAPKQWLQISKLDEKDPNFTANLRRINLRFTISNFILILPIAVMLNCFYAPYMQTLFGEKYIPNYVLLWSILLARVMYTSYSTLYLSLSTMSRTKIFTSLGILIGILNILISCLSVKLLPLIGPAIGTFVASFIGIGVILFLNRQKPHIEAST